MAWIERKQKETHRCRTPMLWWWSRIGHGSIWECPRCDKRWIVGGISMRYWSEDIRLWDSHRW